jgi:hypothetical protein
MKLIDEEATPQPSNKYPENRPEKIEFQIL